MSLLSRDFFAPFRRRTAPAARSPLAEAEPAAIRTPRVGRGPRNRLEQRLARRRRAPVVGAAEGLERRLALAVTVTPITGNGFFFVDTGQGRVLNSEYSGYSITNNDPVTYADVWVQAHNFTGGVLNLSPNEDGVYHLGQLDPAETDKAWFYLTATGSTTAPQSHVISVYNGDPREGGVLIPGATANITFNRVEQTIEASANKVFTVAYDTANPVLGGTLAMTVTGDLGQAGGDSVLFTPDTFNTWQPGVFELETINVQITSGPNVRTVNDELFLTGFASASSNPYTAVYTFRVVDVIATETPVSPTQFVGRGLQWKHDKPIGGAFPPVPAVTNPLLLQKLVAPAGSMDPPLPAITVPDTGETVEFSLTFTNSSTRPVSLDSIRDTLPPGTVYVPGSATFAGLPIGNPTISGSKLTWLGPFPVPASGSATLTFEAVMPALAGVYVNRSVGRVGSVQIDATLDTKDDVPATATVTCAKFADLAITKTDGQLEDIPGTSLVYTITVTNAGPSDVTGVPVSDTFPAILDGVNWTVAYAGGASGPMMGTGNINVLLAMPKNSSATFTVTANIDEEATGTLLNTATVGVPSGVFDPNPANNTSTDTTLLKPTGDLSITKTDGQMTDVPGTGLTYTIVVANTGPSAVTGALVSDAFPPDLTDISWSVTYAGGSGPMGGAGPLLNQAVNLAAGGTATFTVTATILGTARGTLSNTATVAAPPGFTDPNPANNTATDTTTLVPTADLAVVKTRTSGEPVAGSAVEYLISVTNNGPSTILSFKLTDTTAPALLGATFGTPSMGSYDTGTGVWSGLMLGTGQTVTITLSGTVPGTARGELENTAVVEPPADVTDPDLDNNTSIVTDVIELVADLNVVKIRTSGQPVAGEEVTYQITVTNQGPTTIDSFSGLDTTTPPLEDVEFTVNVGTYDPVTGIWTGPPLATGATVVFTLTGIVPSSATGLLVNTATALPPPDVTDPDPDDNTSTVTDEIDLVGDLSIVKSGPASDIPGTSLTYTLVVSNPGPSDVTGAVVNDVLPGSLEGASWTAIYSLGSTGPSDGVGSLSGVLVNLLSGGTATFTIVGTIDPLATGLLENTATVTPPVGFDDPNLENNTSSVTTELVPTADLAVVKTRTSGQPVAGLPVTYSIVVTNLGPSSVTSFTGTDTTTPALEGVDFLVSTGTYDPVLNIWTADPGDSLATGETVIFTLTGTVPSGATGLLVNTVTGLPPDGVIDPDLSNNTSTVTDEIDLVGDLSIVKSGPASDIPGTSLTYTLVVSNPGPSDVTGAVVNDALPGSLEGAAWSVIYSPGSTGPSDGVGSLSGVLVNLLSGGTATFTIVGTIDPLATGLLENTATVTPPEGFEDPNPENNTSSVTTELVPTADLAVVKTRTSGQPVAGLPVTYSIVVTNLGPSSVTSFTGTDTTTPALEGVDFLVSTGTYDPVLNIWTADPGDSLATGETVIFTLSGIVPAGATGLLVNTVTGLPPDGVIDPDLSNNTSTVTDEIGGVIDLAATKTGDATYKGGGLLNFTVVITNLGPTFASGVRVTDALPVGVVNWNWTVSYTGVGSGTADGSPDSVIDSTAGIDKLMNLAVLGTATFTITALTDAAFESDITNTVVATLGQESATASWSSAYDGPINPTADVGALVVSNDDLCFGLPLVRVLDPETGATIRQFLAYEPSFRGSVRVATGDLTGDGVDEIVVAPGRNRIGQIRVFTADGVELPAYRTFAFGPAYRGGVDVAVGDIDGDGDNEIIASRSSGLSRVSVFGVDPLAADPVTNSAIRSFIGIPGAYRNGAVVTAGDYGTFTNGMMLSTVADGIDEIAVGSNAGIRAQVRVFDASATPRQVGSFFAIRPGFRGGVTLSTTRWNLDTAEDLIVGAGVGGRSIVEVYGGTPLSQFARLAAFSSFGRPNAVVNAAALDITGDGVADNLYGVQGRGGSGGTRGVRRFDRISTATSTLPSSTNLVPPLRIAPITLRILGG